MQRSILTLGVFVVALGEAVIPAALGSSRAEYRIIVHPNNPVVRLDRGFVARAFLKKVNDWPHGDAIRPVNLPGDSNVREAFDEEVLIRSVSAVRNYWQQRIFSGGALPPPELGEEEVVEYVLQHRGAIGYVSDRTDIRSAKVLILE